MLFVGLVLTAAEALLPAVLGRAIDAAVRQGHPGYWLLWCAVLVVVLTVCDALDEVASATSTAKSTAWLRRSVVQRILTMPFQRAQRWSAGDLATRAVGNTEAAGGVGTEAVSGLGALLLSAAGVTALALIDPLLCLTFICGFPVLLGLLRAFARDLEDLSERYLQVQAEIAARLVAALRGVRTIAASGTTEREIGRALEPLPELHRHGRATWDVQNRMTARDSMLLGLIEAAVLAVGGYLLAHGRVTAGDLFAASQYVALASTGAGAISTVSSVVRARAAVSRSAAVLAEPQFRYGDVDVLPAGSGTVELRNVTGGCPGSGGLSDVDLVIPGGRLVALVGRRGSGRSLLAQLIGRVVDPETGQIRLDSVPLPQLSQACLRRAVGFGFEQPVLFGRRIGDAIAVGTTIASDAAVVAAAETAGADQFIRKMPNGYQQPLDEAPMSGGEVQRIGLARAFAHAERVLVLDDVAASLDTVTEHKITTALTTAMGDRTRVIVAQRASTAARADLVIWLEAGRVRATGTHTQLCQDPDYRGIFGVEQAASAEPAIDRKAVVAS